MRSSVVAIVLVTRLVTCVQFYSHLPLVGETYVRHVSGRIKRVASTYNKVTASEINPLIRIKRSESLDSPPAAVEDELVDSDATRVDTDAFIAHKEEDIISSGFFVSDEFTFPERMKFAFNVDGEKLRLDLKLNKKQLTHTPVRLVRDGQFVDYDIKAKRDYAFYQLMDEYQGADVMVRCEEFQFPCYLVGRIAKRGREYAIEPKQHTPKLKSKVLHNVHTAPFSLEEDRTHDILFKHDISHKLADIGQPNDIDRAERRLNQSQHRQEQMQYTVELELLIGCSIYEYWLDIRGGDEDAAVETIQAYYELVVNGMDVIYQSARTPGMAVFVRPLEIVIVTTRKDQPWIEDNFVKVPKSEEKVVNIGKAMEQLTRWIYTQSVESDYDAFMLFTRENLAHIGKDEMIYGTTGMGHLSYRGPTYFSLLCFDPHMSGSMVEDGGHNCVVRTAAHELAHNMGVVHDDKGCGMDKYYVMTPISSPSVPRDLAYNPWAFSQCSIDLMEENLERNYNDETLEHCLDEKTSDTILGKQEPLKPPQLGELYPIDQQCALRFGRDSVACSSVHKSNTDVDVCHDGLPCTVDSSNCHKVWGIISTFIGSTCRPGMWCDCGLCTTKPEINDSSSKQELVKATMLSSLNTNPVDYIKRCFSHAELEDTIQNNKLKMEEENPGFECTCTHDKCNYVHCIGVCVDADVCHNSAENNHKTAL